jgi:alanine-synthesizing transaminase
LASLSNDVVIITFNGLSKNYRSCGYRAGWMVVSGDKEMVRDYIEGLNMLASMRLCANVPGQYAIQTALGGYQSINDLVNEGGRLARQRDLAWKLITEIPGVTCVKPKSALYLFPKLDPEMYPIKDDQQFVADLLKEEKVLLVQGSGFNWGQPDHFRIVFLPHEDVFLCVIVISMAVRLLQLQQRHHETDSSRSIRYWHCWWWRIHCA